MIAFMLCIRDPVLQKGFGFLGASYQRRPMLICPITSDFNFLKIEMYLTYNIILVSGIQHLSPQILIIFFSLNMWLVGCQFPDQGLNLGHGSESPESSLLSHQGAPYNFFFLVMRTFNIYPLSNFQIYNTVLLSIVIMLYIISLGLTTGSLYLFTPFTHFTYSHLLPWSF